MMPSDHSRRLQQQLTELVTVERPRLLAFITTVDGKDPADQADRAAGELDLAWVEARIRRLTDRLAAGDTPATPTDGAGALVRGAVLVLDFGDGPETYRFDDLDLDLDDGLDVVTPGSPLGRALAGAALGQPVTYRTPHGEASVTLISVGVPAVAGGGCVLEPA